jgi:tryptophan synthase beta chain
LEPSHALSYAIKLARRMDKNENIVVTLSGRGDKDVEVVLEYLRKRAKSKGNDKRSKKK